MIVTGCVAELLFVGLRVPHVRPVIRVGWEHRLVLWAIYAFKGKAEAELLTSNIKPIQVKLQQNMVIAGVLPVYDYGQGFLLDHFYFSALISC